MNQRKPNNSLWYSLGLAMMLCAAFLIVSTGTTLARYREEQKAELTFSVRAPDQLCLGTIETIPAEETEGSTDESTSTADPTEGTAPTEGEPPAEENQPQAQEESPPTDQSAPGEDTSTDENTAEEEDTATEETTVETTEPLPPGTEVFVPSDGLSWKTADGVSRLEFAVANGNSREEYSQRDQRISLRLIGSLGLWNGTETAAVQILLPSEEDPEVYEAVTATVTQISKQSPLYTTFGDGWIFTFLDEEGEELYWTLEGGSLSFVSLTITVADTEVVDPALLQLQVMGRALEK